MNDTSAGDPTSLFFFSLYEILTPAVSGRCHIDPTGTSAHCSIVAASSLLQFRIDAFDRAIDAPRSCRRGKQLFPPLHKNNSRVYFVFFRSVVYRFLWTTYTRHEKKKMLFLYSIEVKKKKKHCTVSFSFAVVYKTISPSKGRHKKYCSYRRSQRPLRLTRKQVSRTIFFSYLITPVSFHITAFSECERNTKATIAFASDVISLCKARPFLFSCLALFCFVFIPSAPPSSKSVVHRSQGCFQRPTENNLKCAVRVSSFFFFFFSDHG